MPGEGAEDGCVTSPSDRLATWSRWRLEIALTIASLLGLAGFLHELLLTSHPSWIKLVASGAAIAGVPAILARVSAKLGES